MDRETLRLKMKLRQSIDKEIVNICSKRKVGEKERNLIALLYTLRKSRFVSIDDINKVLSVKTVDAKLRRLKSIDFKVKVYSYNDVVIEYSQKAIQRIKNELLTYLNKSNYKKCSQALNILIKLDNVDYPLLDKIGYAMKGMKYDD